nr:myb/SANT-like DNA-binding domain-containing protein 4 [Lytechinus pictus]
MEKKRHDNYSTDEVETLISEVIAREDIIQKQISSSLTNQMKNNAWAMVAEKVSAVAGRVRTPEEVRRKFTVEKSKAKKKAAARKRDSNRTGGGPAPAPIPDWEYKLISFIGDDAISGIVGGMETPSSKPQDPVQNALDTLHTLAELASDRIQVASEPGLSQSTLSPDGKHSPEEDDTPKRRRTNSAKGRDIHDFESTWEQWLSIERERLQIEQERLQVEKDRLALEQPMTEMGLTQTSDERLFPVIHIGFR